MREGFWVFKVWFYRGLGAGNCGSFEFTILIVDFREDAHISTGILDGRTF
jgi:hypothetical protein